MDKKKLKLRNSREFKRVYKYGDSYANKYLVIFFIKNNLNYNRVGFSVTKKIGKSVVRNRIRRLIKEAYRLNCDKLKQGYDLVFIPKRVAVEQGYKEIESAMLHLFKKTKLLK
ncbi:ribonuclease P protein component [Caloranaerobacter azorensis]|uniref:Ribonuclease P protein component n=3 Tax=Caloranaerobacter azorensis TaxID=116090 RepID=A0A1M5W3Z5_9FIRM|nr:ribonuclease P protein component [Caloranaerobacter azorensis]KGG80076.1 ribonuclease P [Caloranaerobacter azorensis H53214]QIB27862.1 ribonuclease P protein component [Caloranaerobacter azorensis]SHH81914.1 ribonuclease P protein component [Caloranaerobacter azorensis DSM 13643]